MNTLYFEAPYHVPKPDATGLYLQICIRVQISVLTDMLLTLVINNTLSKMADLNDLSLIIIYVIIDDFVTNSNKDLINNKKTRYVTINMKKKRHR